MIRSFVRSPVLVLFFVLISIVGATASAQGEYPEGSDAITADTDTIVAWAEEKARLKEMHRMPGHGEILAASLDDTIKWIDGHLGSHFDRTVIAFEKELNWVEPAFPPDVQETMEYTKNLCVMVLDMIEDGGLPCSEAAADSNRIETAGYSVQQLDGFVLDLEACSEATLAFARYVENDPRLGPDNILHPDHGVVSEIRSRSRDAGAFPDQSTLEEYRLEVYPRLLNTMLQLSVVVEDTKVHGTRAAANLRARSRRYENAANQKASVEDQIPKGNKQ